MSSSQPGNNVQDHQQLNRESARSSSSSSSGNDSRAPEIPCPAASYHHPMGYPQSMAYPPPPPGQYPYPPQPAAYPNYNHHYHYAQAPPGQYYTTQMYTNQQEYLISGLLRGIVGALVFLLILTCLSSIIIWIVLRPSVPIFKFNQLSVSNFNPTSSPSFTAIWDANITVENPNTKLKVYFDQIEAFIYYNEDDLLATSFTSPFYLDIKAKTIMQTKLEANNTDRKHAGVGSWVVEQMAEDKKRKGNVTFDIRIALWSTYTSGSWWKRHVIIRVYCEELVVSFVGNKGSANIGSDKFKDCLVFA